MSTDEWAAEAQAARATGRGATPYLILGVLGLCALVALACCSGRPREAGGAYDAQVRSLLSKLVAEQQREAAKGNGLLSDDELRARGIDLKDLEKYGYTCSFLVKSGDWSVLARPGGVESDPNAAWFEAKLEGLREARGDWPR